MPIEVQSCPLCGGTASRPFDRRRFLGIPVSNRICRECGLVFQSPRMSPEEAAGFYRGDYRRLYQHGAEGPTPGEIEFQRRRAASLLEIFPARKVKRHLDIGCSAGLLLAAFREAFGCESAGIEPGDAFRDYALRQGLEVFPSLEALQASRVPPFDLVSMMHVLEHLPDPVAYLSGLRQTCLAPDGWLFLEVPNLHVHDSFEVAHLVSFSAHTLAEVLKKAGYEIVQSLTHGRPRTRLSPLYVNVIARPSVRPLPAAVQAETGVRRKRAFGIFMRFVWDVLYFLARPLRGAVRRVRGRR